MGAREGLEAGRFELLAAVGEVADGSLPFGMTVERLLEIVVPAFADLALLDGRGTDSSLRRLGVRVDGARRAELEAALMRRRRVPNAPVGVARSVTDGESHLLAPVTEEHLRLIASSEEDLELLRALELRASLFVPLRARGRILGALACGVGSSGRSYRAEDLRFAEVLAGRISLALDNAGLSRMVGDLEQQLEATFASLAEAVLVRDPAGAMVFANPAAAHLLGFESEEELRSTTAQELLNRYDAYDEEGRPLALADLPSAKAFSGETPEPLLVRNVVRGAGAERWLLHKATPVLDEEGQTSLVVNVIEDLTDVKRAELAQRLLAEAGRELASSLDYEQTLSRVASLSVPQLADWCGVRVRGPHGELTQVAVGHVDPAKVALAREFGERYPTRVDDGSGAARVVATGESILAPEITPRMVAQADVSAELAALIRDLEMRSVIIVPLVAPGQPPIGALTLVMAESGRRFDERDLALAEELGRRAGMAAENARLYTERSVIASTLQESLLPEALPQIGGFQLASLYRAAGEQSEVGGDFYDVFAVPSGWIVLVGDVTGRGPQAAALTSLARYTMRTAARLLGDPVAAFEQLNIELRERSHPSLVTIACALVRETSTGTEADVVLAGHPPPYHLRGGLPAQVGEFGSPLGAYPVGNWRGETITLEPGDQLILYTDGVIDTVGERDRFGEQRLAGVLSGAAGAADAVARIDGAVTEFASGPQTDDTAVLALERVSAVDPRNDPDAFVTGGATPAG